MGPDRPGGTEIASMLFSTSRSSYRNLQALFPECPGNGGQAGGKDLARGGALTTPEGDPGVKRVVILEFPSEAALRSCYDSEEYRPYQELRERVTRSKAFIVAGM